KSNLARSCTVTSSSPKDTVLPTERSDANATRSLTGKLRSCKVFIISWPTLPVAPTIATLYAIHALLIQLFGYPLCDMMGAVRTQGFSFGVSMDYSNLKDIPIGLC